MKQIYLDHAAATPVDPAVFAVMEDYYSKLFYNPSAIYLKAKETKKALNEARSNIGRLIGAKPPEIIFTSGGSEANNLAINGVMAGFKGKKLIVSSIEHDSVLAPAGNYIQQKAPVNELGVVDVTKLESIIDDDTVLVSVMYANNEVGSIQPIKEVGKIISDIRRERQKRGIKLPIYLHTDACQAANYLDLHVERLEVDLMTVNGGKIYGPKQTGFLYVRAGIVLKPQIEGGGQEFGIRSGTENVAGIAGLAKAFELAQSKKNEEVNRLKTIQKLFMNELKKLPKITINGSTKNRLPNNIHFAIEGCDNERLIMELDEKGIMCAAGSACSASKETPSHVLKAMGFSDEYAQSSVRMTTGQLTTEQDISRTIKSLKEIIDS